MIQFDYHQLANVCKLVVNSSGAQSPPLYQLYQLGNLQSGRTSPVFKTRAFHPEDSGAESQEVAPRWGADSGGILPGRGSIG